MPKSDRRLFYAAIASMVALGLGFRLWSVDWARFTGDESHFWYVARRLATLEHVPVLGPEVTGTPAHLPGPAFHVLTAIPQLLGSSPRWGGYWMVLLHVAAGLGLIHLAHRAWSRAGALLAAALWMWAPWDVLYGDRVWASCLAPALGALAIWAAAVSRERPRWLAVSVLLCLLMPQIHLSAPILWVSVAVLLVLRPPCEGWKRPALVGLGLGVIAYLPFLVVELRSGFANTRAILEHSGGSESGAGVWLVPLKVIGYGVLYASPEIGYHHALGFWGGGFDELQAYGTGAGLAEIWARSPWLALGSAIGVLLAVVAWLVAYGSLLGSWAQDPRRAWQRPWSLDAALSASMALGLCAGAALMMSARKSFFPHYANILMPFALWPAVGGLVRLYRRPRPVPRLVLLAVLAISILAMGANGMRFYRRVDGLNGLAATLGMVERAHEVPAPISVRFTYFRNDYAWNLLSRGHFGRPLPLGAARTELVVHNRPDAEAPGEAFGAARLEVRPVRAWAPESATFSALEQWREARVSVRGAEFEPSRLTQDRITYGPNPWQRLQPEGMRMGGRELPLLFMHPVSSATVSATWPIPSGVRRGRIRFGLTDGAHRSSNPAPVRVTVRRGSAVVFREETPTSPGVRVRELTVPEGAGSLSVELWTVSDGARVFGFDLWLAE